MSGCHFASMAKRKKHSHTNFHTKFPSSVIIRGVVSSEGHELPQHFLQEDLRVNAAGYIGVLETRGLHRPDIATDGYIPWLSGRAG